MEWSKWAELEPKSREEVIAKMENDGYTYPHFDKTQRGVKFVICTEAIQKDCKTLDVAFDDVYPLQTKLFEKTGAKNEVRLKYRPSATVKGEIYTIWQAL